MILDMREAPYPRSDAKACVGKGWGGLVDEIYDLLAASDEDSIVTQIKEKFGGLRFYYSGPFQDEVDAICDRSYTICEECGEAGKTHTVQGYLWTLCPEHLAEHMSEEEK